MGAHNQLQMKHLTLIAAAIHVLLRTFVRWCAAAAAACLHPTFHLHTCDNLMLVTAPHEMHASVKMRKNNQAAALSPDLREHFIQLKGECMVA